MLTQALRRARKREQLVIVAALATVAIVTWTSTVESAVSMSTMSTTTTTHSEWSMSRWVAIGTMWVVMMTAMMVPSAAPMILMHARLAPRTSARSSLLRSAAFTAGYLVVWSSFGLLAAAGQWSLAVFGNIAADDGGRLRASLGAALLVAAGSYQFTPLKHVCLSTFRIPVGRLLTQRRGALGAFREGLGIGVSCTGCCLGLAAVLFAVGIMNIVWLALLTVLIAMEKLLVHGHRIANISGLALIAAGCYLLGSALAST